MFNNAASRIVRHILTFQFLYIDNVIHPKLLNRISTTLPRKQRTTPTTTVTTTRSTILPTSNSVTISTLISALSKTTKKPPNTSMTYCYACFYLFRNSVNSKIYKIMR